MAIVESEQKVLGFSDITFMTVVGNFGIRWLAVAASLGAVSIFYWIVGALMFFIPLSLICAILSRACPKEGGVYAWTKEVLGDKSAFIVAWLYWVNNIFYYPAILIFLASNLAYALGMPMLIDNHWYVTVVVLVSFWLVVLINTYGMKSSKFLVKFGGILGSFVPAAILIVLGFVSFIIYQKSATDFSLINWLPNRDIFGSLSTLTMIMFAMAGVEIIPTFAKSVKNPARDLYAGLLVGALIILVLYVLGTVAMNIIATPDELQKASGLMQAFELVNQRLGIPWLTPIIGFILIFSELAAVSIWLLAPIIMFFKCIPKGILPEWFHQTNRHGSPQNATMFMGILVSLVVILTNTLPSIENMYQILVLMATILYFIPYLFLAVVFVKFRHQLRLPNFFVYTLSLFVFSSIILGISFSFEPPGNLTTIREIIQYEAQMIGGATIIIGLGFWLYKRKRI